MAGKLYPTLIVDPNGPWHHDAESGEDWLVAHVSGEDFITDLEDGSILVDDLIIEFMPYGDNQETDEGWSAISRIKGWFPVEREDKKKWYLVYLAPTFNIAQSK